MEQSSHSVTPPITASSTPPKRRCVMVCQHRSCTRNGSEDVLAALRAEAVPGVLVAASDCLGQCASGPTVQVMPDGVWYCRVTVQDVEAIATQHLYGNEPVKRLLHPRFHPPTDTFTES